MKIQNFSVNPSIESISEVRIASCHEYEQKYIRDLLKSLDINPSKAKYKFYIAISGIGNFKKLKKFDVFEIHPIKKKKFDAGYNNLVLGE